MSAAQASRCVQTTNKLMLQLCREFPLPDSPQLPGRTDARHVAARLGRVGHSAHLQFGWTHDSGQTLNTAIVYCNCVGDRTSSTVKCLIHLRPTGLITEICHISSVSKICILKTFVAGLCNEVVSQFRAMTSS